MTAKEILQNQTNNGYELLEDEGVMVGEVLVAMRIFAKQKCKEQREIIAEDCFSKRSFSVKLQKIVLNAPEPKFD